MAMDAEAKLDDMNVVIEILIRLPPKSVFRFISVSKTWEKTISTDPLFLRSYSRRQNSANRRRLLAILEKKTKQHLDPERPPAQYIRFPDNPHVEIEQNDQFVFNSSNGLFLTGFLPSTFHVVNPVTKKCVALPPPPIACKTSVAIMCEDNFSELKANYIVLRAQQSLQNNIMQIDTYSSRTGEWTRSVLVATGSFELSLKPPTVANGVFHWNTTDLKTMVVYDPNDSLKNHVQLIQKPKCRSQLGEVTRSTTDDILWLFMIDTEHWKLFMLPKGGDSGLSYSRKTTISDDEWVLMHCISHDSLIKNGFRSMYVENGLIISWNPFAIVVGLGEIIFPHNLEMTYTELGFYNYNFCPYFETDSLSAYTF